MDLQHDFVYYSMNKKPKKYFKNIFGSYFLFQLQKVTWSSYKVVKINPESQITLVIKWRQKDEPENFRKSF